MKLAIIGSRTFDDYEFLKQEALKLKPLEIVSGGAKGTDTLAERFATEYKLPITIFYPRFMINEHIPYHPKYFFERNKFIVDYCDKILAFQIGNSKGTQHAIDYVKKINKELILFKL